MYLNFAKFRTSNHRFPCEVGRYHNIELSDRKCTLCDKNDVGDEMHYLLICPYFDDDRIKFIPKYCYTRTNIIKFKQIMCLSLAQFCDTFLCPRRNFGLHIKIEPSVRLSVRSSVRQSVRPLQIVSQRYLINFWSKFDETSQKDKA